jgi:hypothetical protein
MISLLTHFCIDMLGVVMIIVTIVYFHAKCHYDSCHIYVLSKPELLCLLSHFCIAMLSVIILIVTFLYRHA